MKRIRVQLRWIDGAYSIALPVWTMIPGTMTHGVAANGHADGVLPGKDPAKVETDGAFVDIWIPDEHYNDRTNRPDLPRIRDLYRDSPRFRALSDADVPLGGGR